MSYKKSLVSLVAAMALSNSVSADPNATYLPLTTPSNDTSWTLFGVNGFSNGVPSNAVAGPTSFSSGLTELDDADATDDLATSGLTAGSGDLAALQGLSEAGLSSVKVGVNISGLTFESTEPVRSMYVKVNSTTPNVKLFYKASMEGRNMEIILNNSTTTIYSVTISQESTYANAATAVEGVITSTTDTSNLTDVLLAVDADSTDNPVNPANWDKSLVADGGHYTAYNNTDDSVTFYRFDAITQEWKIYKNVNSTAANDFDRFHRGNAYWGRIDLGNADANLDANDADGATNLVLGKSGNSLQSQLPAAYLDENNVSKLAAGWNMLAFDDIKPYIRHAATGLILSSVAAGDVLNVIDETGVYNTGNITLAGAAEEGWATQINTTIESLRLRGIVPEAFNIRAFTTGTAGQLVIVSDAKFAMGVTAAGGVGVTTLTGANPFVNATATAVADLSAAAAPVYSVYGEYAMMIEALTGAATADNAITTVDNAEGAQVTFGDSLNSDHTAINLANAGTSNLATAQASIAAEPTLTPTVTQVDTDFDGAGDMLIVANDTPFYIRDNTFTRVFQTDTTAANNTLAFTVSGTTTALIEPALNDAPSAVATEINLDAGTTDVYASANVADNRLAVFSTANSNLDLKDIADNTIDFLRTSTDGTTISDGAVKGVFSLDELAKKPLIQYSWEYTSFYDGTTALQPLEADDGVEVDVTGSGAVNVLVGAGLAADLTNTALRLDYFDRIVAEANTQIVANGLHGFASHNYTEAVDNFTGTTVTITGVDMSDTSIIVEVDGVTTAIATPIVGAGADANAGSSTTLGTLAGDLVDDLKFNAVYTPNYANYGPLYTMYDSGYDVLAILRASTNFTDESITWDSIDITRNEDDWFIQNEFNVFNVNLASGYWVYLADRTENNISISGASFTPTYSYYFDNDTDHTTTNNVVGGQLRVTVDGLVDTSLSLAGATSNVYAIISGEEVQMKINSGTEYTADITKFESVDFKESAGTISISVRATNGKGQAVLASDAVTFDYEKPAAPTVTYPNVTSAIFTSTSTDTEKFYVYQDAIPEGATARSTALVKEVDATAGSGTENICAEFDFGVVNTLRIVAADGVDGSANISDATEINYASLFKGASVITHLNDGITDKATLPTVYDTTCTLAATQPTGSENTGVSIKALISGKSARIAYVADPNVSFNTNLAWDSIYTIGGTEVIQLQNVEVYATDKFLIEYEGNLYEGTFPANQAAADATVATPVPLTQITPANTSLAP